MLAYKLNSQIDGGKLLQDVQKLISNEVKPTGEYVLVIKVQEIVYTEDASVPKIEHHHLDQ